MDVCPSLPSKRLTGEPAKHTPGMAAVGCRLAVCSLFVQLVIIGMFPSLCAMFVIAQPSLYKIGPSILSRTFCRKNNFQLHLRNFDNYRAV
jgi:hypothetical protein